MSADNDLVANPTIFSAVLTPNRSLGATGFVVLMAVLGGISFIAGMVFLILGAWPVFGFFGLDLLLVYYAFRVNYRTARAYEVVTVTPCELTVAKVNHHGRMQQWTLNPLWVQMERDEHEEFGIQRLFLVSRGQKLPIASFLGAQEKKSFAVALSGALAEARRGPTRTVIEG